MVVLVPSTVGQQGERSRDRDRDVGTETETGREEEEEEERKSCESFHEHKLADRRNDG